MSSLSPPPFLIFSSPRSRSFWLSTFLTSRPWTCYHEEIRHLRSLEDAKSFLSLPYVGAVETALAPWWRLCLHLRPDLRVVVIRRPVEDVVASFRRVLPGVDAGLIHKQAVKCDRKLAQISTRLPSALSLPYAALSSPQTLANLSEFCHGTPCDPGRAAALSQVNLQIDLPALLRYMAGHSVQIARLTSQARLASLRLFADKPASPLGITFAEESFDTFLRDGADLFREHCALVGEHTENFMHKNHELARALERSGAAHIITARCNGKMFGYHTAILSPSMESPDIMSACGNTFYASPDFPGLGLKLLRASLAALRAKGVDEIYLRAGHRGAGPRMGPLLRRVGGEDAGELYRVQLGKEIPR